MATKFFEVTVVEMEKLYWHGNFSNPFFQLPQVAQPQIKAIGQLRTGGKIRHGPPIGLLDVLPDGGDKKSADRPYKE